MSSGGSRHLFETVSLMKEQLEKVQAIVLKVLQRNSYFAHPENVNLSMITDD